MKVTLTIDDEIWDIYRQESIDRRMTPGDLLRERLAKAVGLDPRTRAMVLPGDRFMQQLEERLGGGQIANPMDLLNKVIKLAAIRFGDHEFKITPGQWRELAFRASKMGPGKTPADLVEEIYRRVSTNFFEYVP